jgi:hypothetical protein
MKIHEIHFYLVRVSDPFPPSLGSRYIHSCIPGLLPGDRCEIRCLPPQFLGDPVVAQCSTENTETWRAGHLGHRLVIGGKSPI